MDYENGRLPECWNFCFYWNDIETNGKSRSNVNFKSSLWHPSYWLAAIVSIFMSEIYYYSMVFAGIFDLIPCFGSCAAISQWQKMDLLSIQTVKTIRNQCYCLLKKAHTKSISLMKGKTIKRIHNNISTNITTKIVSFNWHTNSPYNNFSK